MERPVRQAIVMITLLVLVGGCRDADRQQATVDDPVGEGAGEHARHALTDAKPVALSVNSFPKPFVNAYRARYPDYRVWRIVHRKTGEDITYELTIFCPKCVGVRDEIVNSVRVRTWKNYKVVIDSSGRVVEEQPHPKAATTGANATGGRSDNGPGAAIDAKAMDPVARDLPAAVVKAYRAIFPSCRLWRCEQRGKGADATYELTVFGPYASLCHGYMVDSCYAESLMNYKLLVSSTGGVIREDPHGVFEITVPKVVRDAFAEWRRPFPGRPMGATEWTARQAEGAQRLYLALVLLNSVEAYGATFTADGAFTRRYMRFGKHRNGRYYGAPYWFFDTPFDERRYTPTVMVPPDLRVICDSTSGRIVVPPGLSYIAAKSPPATLPAKQPGGNQEAIRVSP